MMHEVFPSKINGSVQIPASKSFVQRFIAAAVLANGQSEISNPGASDDILAATHIAEQIGADVRRLANGNILISGGVKVLGQNLFCRESGLCARLFAPIAAINNKSFEISGLPGLNRRNLIHDFDQLKQLGLSIQYENNGLPVNFSGNLNPGTYRIDCSKSSQLLSGLLFAMPMLNADSVIIAENLVSRPYVKMTLSMIRKFGVQIEEREANHFHIPGNQKYKAQKMPAEGDWSAASNLIIAAGLTGSLKLENLNVRSAQADVKVLETCKNAKIPYSIENNTLIVQNAKPTGFDLDIMDCPDLFPAILPLACAADSVSHVYHVERLMHKESNRLDAAIREYTKLGAKFIRQKDSLEIHPAPLRFADVNSWGDHRIIMSLSVAALANRGAMIHDSDHVSKSWPDFFNQLKSIGGEFHAHLR
ncbi:MAG: 3-phosphoshikimate 1-carboxyvinyltransferase [Bacteroidales bacterium]|jgi:3-phosphoshikimate 1-carboxyvinyltransferase|nr:3-phosphoshikimate 1-carboxyvinyltransferase [Bacteroidales bacterium]